MYKKLRETRNKKGVSAKKMAAALGLKTKAAYYKKESGLTRFSIDEAKIVSELLGEPVETLFFDSEVSIKGTSGTQAAQ